MDTDPNALVDECEQMSAAVFQNIMSASSMVLNSSFSRVFYYLSVFEAHILFGHVVIAVYLNTWVTCPPTQIQCESNISMCADSRRVFK